MGEEGCACAARQSIEARYNPTFRPALAPSFSSAFLALDRTLWLERFRADPLDAVTYAVLDMTGRHLSNVAIPKGFSPREFGADCVLGFATDADGVQSVAMYRLQR